VLARVIEAAGIPTVTVTMMPILSDKYRSSRTLGVQFPFGHSFGVAEPDRRTQHCDDSASLGGGQEAT
jgi:hypothetical protein